MAYDKIKEYEKAIAIIKKDSDIVFVEDLLAEISMSKATFYSHFPIESNELNTIKELLGRNQIQLKKQLRKNWKDSQSSATVQIALYKLIANPDELQRLNPPKQKEEEVKQVKPIVEWTEEPNQNEDKKENE